MLFWIIYEFKPLHYECLNVVDRTEVEISSTLFVEVFLCQLPVLKVVQPYQLFVYCPCLVNTYGCLIAALVDGLQPSKQRRRHHRRPVLASLGNLLLQFVGKVLITLTCHHCQYIGVEHMLLSKHITVLSLALAIYA